MFFLNFHYAKKLSLSHSHSFLVRFCVLFMQRPILFIPSIYFVENIQTASLYQLVGTNTYLIYRLNSYSSMFLIFLEVVDLSGNYVANFYCNRYFDNLFFLQIHSTKLKHELSFKTSIDNVIAEYSSD